MERFHLSFEYFNAAYGHVNRGDQVVFAESIEDASRKIAQERGLKEITIRHRFHANIPDRVDQIERKFNFAAA